MATVATTAAEVAEAARAELGASRDWRDGYAAGLERAMDALAAYYRDKMAAASEASWRKGAEEMAAVALAKHRADLAAALQAAPATILAAAIAQAAANVTSAIQAPTIRRVIERTEDGRIVAVVDAPV